MARRDRVVRWDTAPVLAFLDLNNLGMYKRNFEEKGVTGGSLMQLDENYMRDQLGIKDEYHMNRLGTALDWNFTFASQIVEEKEHKEGAKSTDKGGECGGSEGGASQRVGRGCGCRGSDCWSYLGSGCEGRQG